MHGAGLGVDLRVAADAVITNKALLTADSLGAGRARDLRLTAGSVQIDNSIVGSRAFDSGNAGYLSISTPLLTMDAGLIQANAERAVAATRAASRCRRAVHAHRGRPDQQQHFWQRGCRPGVRFRTYFGHG